MILTLKGSDIYTGNLILVNQEHAYQEPVTERAKETDQEKSWKEIQEDGAKRSGEKAKGDDLVCMPDSQVCMQACAAEHLRCLLRDIRAGRQIVPVSGWRSREEQQRIWDDSLAEHGQSFTETYVAVPGHSEHQTGLAIDLGRMQDTIDFICPDFPYEGICQRFREKASAYGFVERYPKGREPITGIGHEPWHFRYVGVPHASIMEEHAMTLEEYMDFLRQFPFGHRQYRTVCHGQMIDLSFFKVEPGQEEIEYYLEMDRHLPFMVSGNNADGFIITEWRQMYA